MSPIGGVGINLAIQDAVAAANILVQPILGTAVTSEKLQEVRKRREFPTKMTQGFQVFAHKRFITRALNRRTPLLSLPLPLQLLKQFPILRRIPARLLGLGFRPEHVQTPDMNHGTGDSAIARSGDLESPDGH
jgi:2-polyprenyl-6-methoxyphenol hydroxylase-like FAD-dependent oxidoreductase